MKCLLAVTFPKSLFLPILCVLHLWCTGLFNRKTPKIYSSEHDTFCSRDIAANGFHPSQSVEQQVGSCKRWAGFLFELSVGHPDSRAKCAANVFLQRHFGVSILAYAFAWKHQITVEHYNLFFSSWKNRHKMKAFHLYKGQITQAWIQRKTH